MKDLSQVDIGDIAKEWESRLNPAPRVKALDQPKELQKPVLLQKPIRNVPAITN